MKSCCPWLGARDPAGAELLAVASTDTPANVALLAEKDAIIAQLREENARLQGKLSVSPATDPGAAARSRLREVLASAASLPRRQKPGSKHEWNITEWLASLKLHEALASQITSQISTPDAQLHFVKTLAQRPDGSELINALLVGASGALTDKMWSGMVALRDAKASTAQDLVSKFRSEEGAFEMQFGNLATFFKGLEALIGPPSPNFVEAMAREHCSEADSDVAFTTGNYIVTTKSIIEWWFCFDPEAGLEHLKLSHWPYEKALRSEDAAETRDAWGETEAQPRKAMPLSRIRLCAKSFNDALKPLSVPSLLDAELLAGRLYTGPQFVKYNAVLRKFTGQEPLSRRFHELCLGNLYSTTIHAVNSLLIKLSKVTKVDKVYRGVEGGVLPKQFLEPDEFNVCSAVDFGFMSTSLSRDVAVTYASTGAATVFEMDMGMVDRGADLHWLSQYPHETEICFPPLTGIEVTGMRVERVMLVVQARLSVNTSALTLEQVVAKMQSSHLQLLKVISDDLRFVGAPDKTLAELKSLESHALLTEPLLFNNAETFASFTNRALATQSKTLQYLGTQLAWDEETGEAASEESRAKRMFACAGLCARVGEHAAAAALLKLSLSLVSWSDRHQRLRCGSVACNDLVSDRVDKPRTRSIGAYGHAPQTWASTGSKLKKIINAHGAVQLIAKAGDTASGLREHAALEESLTQAMALAAEHGAPSEECWRIEAAGLLMASGTLQPWPGTIVKLAEEVPGTAEAVALLARSYLNVDCFKPGAMIAVTCDMGDCFHTLCGELKAVNEDGTFECLLDHGRRHIPSVKPEDVKMIDEQGVGALLRMAAQMDARKVTRALLEVGVSVLLVDARFNTALHMAARKGNAQVCKMLVDARASPYDTNDEPLSSFEIALHAKDAACLHVFKPTKTDDDLSDTALAEAEGVELLCASAKGVACSIEAALARGAEIGTTVVNGVGALHLAARGGHIISVGVLLSAGAEVNARTRSGITPLLLAVEEGCVKVVEKLCHLKGIDVSAMDVTQRSPLGIAAETGRVELLTPLLQANAALDTHNSHGRTPLAEACSFGHVEAVKLLLASKANHSFVGTAKATNRGKDTALIAACRSGNIEVVTLLIEAKADPNLRPPVDEHSANLDGWTPLIEASCKGKDAIVHLLLTARADANLNLKGNAGAIYFAGCNGHLKSCQMLVEANATVDNADLSNGRNALWWASKEGHTVVVRYLLEVGANPQHQLHERAERAGTSPVHMAAQHGHSACIKLLLEHRGSCAQVEKAGNTPLHLASMEGHEECAKVLVANGASAAATNFEGKTAADVANAARHMRVARLIEDATGSE